VAFSKASARSDAITCRTLHPVFLEATVEIGISRIVIMIYVIDPTFTWLGKISNTSIVENKKSLFVTNMAVVLGKD
jgi:hypothetical protein